MKNRFIFEVDDTLLRLEPHTTEEYFYELFGEESYEVSPHLRKYLRQYEQQYKRYNIKELSRFLTMKTGFDITPRVIIDWIDILGNGLDFKEEEAEMILEDLKRNGKSVAILTNWFKEIQVSRLKNAGFLDYIDDIYTGDEIVKPNKEAYLKALGDYSKEESLVIGYNLTRDYIAPKALGIDAILYDKEGIVDETVPKVKKLSEIKKYY